MQRAGRSHVEEKTQRKLLGRSFLASLNHRDATPKSFEACSVMKSRMCPVE